ncbi:peptidylprolyl isomerase [Actinosynnema sp. NPDC047251]|uniref:Peptidyl-prolyl cis-trans isomerase n=1 Tax=Saccharothrix espanaensis (strain ATCC 51144 / DSM 44229 / JCM 9112 / NBRC 15066 / NRRL 15764) TaxID=1179773 RepID=K0JZR8_SACES|nr:peptidylprolyl isomerase [Saccharothrix espanaensis]CCH30797.1 Cyclophilin, peptidyl-prolyl cis-trans isomerase type [Saccharothrix espanaensis DSM 44229]
MGRYAASAVILLTALLGVATPTAGAAPAQPRPVKHCAFTPTPDNPPAKPVRPPRATAPTKGSATTVLHTNYGTVVIRLDRSVAACAAHNFEHLVRNLFYHNTQCFRLTNSARLGVLQCGDIHRAEEGGPGYKFDDEVTGSETYPRGTVAMGNQGPGTNGSEFFIVHSHANISPVYSVFGHVVHGMDTLDRIVAAGITGDTQDGLPKRPVRIHWAFTLPV